MLIRGNTFPGKQVVFNVAHMVKNANRELGATKINPASGQGGT